MRVCWFWPAFGSKGVDEGSNERTEMDHFTEDGER